MKFTFILILFVFFTNVANCATNQDEIVLKVSKSWLELLDKGKFKECYNESSSSFKSKVTAKKWEHLMSWSRDSWGKLISRQLQSKKLSTQPQDAPIGEYTIIQFSSHFSAKKQITESVILVFEKDKNWRVFGYSTN